VIDPNRSVADQVADVARDLREVVGPVGLKGNNHYDAGLFHDIEIRHSLEKTKGLSIFPHASLRKLTGARQRILSAQRLIAEIPQQT
jgi:hypothetical protein